MIATKIILQEHLIRSENDANIADIILGYLMEECECCEDKVLDGLNVECVYNHKYHDDINSNDCKICADIDIEICDICKEEQCCYNCGDFICESCYDDERHYCDEERCSRLFCDSCQGEAMFFCESCEEWNCCQGIYRINIGGEDKFICKVCIKEDFIPPHFD